MTEMKDKILNWFANGSVGVSSQAMACAAAGIENGSAFGNCPPSDPDDFNRCLLLLVTVPEIREHMDKVAALSPTWAALVDRWNEVEVCFLNEVGLNWCKGRRATKTYRLMKEIGC